MSATQTQVSAKQPVEIEVEEWLTPAQLQQSLLDEVRRGLTARPRELSPRWLYDERGSLLFEEITRLPEYYPTRRERRILSLRAREIARVARASTLIELGSGSSEKTRVLLEAFSDLGTLERFVPFDVSAPMLRESARSVAAQFPGLRVHAVVGDFEHHLGRLPQGGRRMVAFLGGTIGNFKPQARRRFLADLASGLRVGDTLLLGTDLIKDTRRLHAAYNDSLGVTAEFNLNVLRVLNRELRANFDLDAFEHLARFDEEQQWIEMLLRSKKAQSVAVDELGLSLQFDEGELVRTEVSCKFSPDQVERELDEAGFRLLEWWTDDAGDFAVTLSTVKASGG